MVYDAGATGAADGLEPMLPALDQLPAVEAGAAAGGMLEALGAAELLA